MNKVSCLVALRELNKAKVEKDVARKNLYNPASETCKRCGKCLETAIGDPVTASLKQSGAPERI